MDSLGPIVGPVGVSKYSAEIAPSITTILDLGTSSGSWNTFVNFDPHTLSIVPADSVTFSVCPNLVRASALFFFLCGYHISLTVKLRLVL